MLKFLYFADSDSNGQDTACMPVSLLRAMKIDTNSDGVTFEFKDTGDGLGAEVSLKVETKRDKAAQVAEAVSEAIRKSQNPFIVVADDLRGEYIHPDIVGMETTDLFIT